MDGYSPRFDLIFLDIEMKDMNGMKAARKIRETDEKVLLVFLTHMSMYAIHGYAVQASDYILKPLPYELFAGKMKEWVRRIERSRESSTVIGSGEEKIKMATDHIYYIEIIGHRLIYHTDQGNIEAWEKLRTVDEELSGKGFSRMLNYECVIYGLKGLLWGLPAAVVLTFLVWKVMSQGMNQGFCLPWYSILLAVFSVFAVVFATMLYARSRLRRDNLIDALRNENL